MIIKATLLINNRGRRGFPAYSQSFIWTVACRCGFWHLSWWCYFPGCGHYTVQGLTDDGNEWDRLGIIHWEVVMKCGTQTEAYLPSVKASE